MDDLLELIKRHERSFFAHFAHADERPWGVLYHNVENPASHDSNHAVVLDPRADLEAAVDEAVAFYTRRRLTPRFYTAYLPGEEGLLAVLARRDYRVQVSDDQAFLHTRPSRVRPNPALEVRRVRALTPALEDLINSERPQPWSIGVLRRHLMRDDFHHFAGYVDGVPVTQAALLLHADITAVNDVKTHFAHRGRGYARMLMHCLVDYHRDMCDQPLYLLAVNPVAIRVYEDVGFVSLGPLPHWQAFAGAE